MASIIFSKFLTFLFSRLLKQLDFMRILGRFFNIFGIVSLFILMIFLSYILSVIFISGIFTDQQENEYTSGYVNSTPYHTVFVTDLFSKIVITVVGLILFRLSCNKRPTSSSFFSVSILSMVFIKYHHSDNNEFAKEQLKCCTRVVFYCYDSIFFSNLINYIDL